MGLLCRVIGAAAVAAILLGGCGQVRLAGPSARPVTLDDFAAPPEAPKAAAPPEAPQQQPADAADSEAPVTAGALASDADGRTRWWSVEPGRRIVVDSLVGEVNGRPIFADDVLEPIEDRLLEEAEGRTFAERRLIFRAIILDTLRDIIDNALVLSEAEAALSVEEQRGLFAFLQSMKEDIIRASGGTRARTEQTLQREGVRGLEDYLEVRRQVVVIQQLFLRRIAPRVVVTWRDIEREYQRNYDEFNPPATVNLSRIVLNTFSRADDVEAVTRRLAAGEPFAEVARDMGMPDGGRWARFEMGPGGVGDIEVRPEIRRALEGLGVGQSSEPFTIGSATLWVHVDSIERPPRLAIWDRRVQRLLTARVRSQREQREWSRYLKSLKEQSIVAELSAMGERLVQIALERYGR